MYKVCHHSEQRIFERIEDARLWAFGEAERQARWQGLNLEELESYGDLEDGDEQEGICPDGDPGHEWPVIERAE